MRLVLSTGLILIAAGRAFADPCPDNGISAGCWPDAIGYTSSLPAAQLGPSGVEAWTIGQPCTHGCYDLVNGRVVAVGAVNTQGGCLGGVQVSDVYTLMGRGTDPVSFYALMEFGITRPAGGHWKAHLYVEGGPSGEASDATIPEIFLPLSAVPGVPFTLHADIEAYGDQSIQPLAPVIADATILFGTPGYWIVSCRGYDVPTPAHPTSWGGVKALYR